MDNTPEYRFYRDLADWWPLISPPEEYDEELSYVASLLSRASIPVRTVLELGSGGGHVAFHLKQQFELTLVDLSEQMLEVSRRLNPECVHLQGDMRTIRLDREFDAVFVYDAVDYMTTETDLVQAMETHRTGLFSRDTWVHLLTQVGFEPQAIVEETSEDRIPRELFLGRRPAGP